jgi:cytochrome c-type biogenesis protein CcmE
MKKTHIFALFIIAVAAGIILSTAGDASTYVDFTQAEELAMSGDNGSIHVVGSLKKDASGQIVGMQYSPEVDPNRFVFTLLDNNNREQLVVYPSSKPQDFDKSEKVVVIGRMEKDHFAAEKILLKCPSKYENDKLETTEFEAAKL